jgi:hypothetical protein
MERAFQPSAGMRDATRKFATNFWSGQEQMLDGLEEYARGWLGRRHQATQSALSACERMCDAESPFEAMRECQKWAIGAFGRMMEDGLECQKQLLAAGRLFAPPLSPVEETATETRQRQPTRPRAPAA